MIKVGLLLGVVGINLVTMSLPSLAFSGSKHCPGGDGRGIISYSTYWGTGGRANETWVSNRSHHKLYVQLNLRSGSVDNGIVKPFRSRTFYSRGEIEGIECKVW